MTREQQAAADARAKAFIDQIIEINRQFGMGSDVPPDTYQNAVDGSANAFRALVERAS